MAHDLPNVRIAFMFEGDGHGNLWIALWNSYENMKQLSVVTRIRGPEWEELLVEIENARQHSTFLNAEGVATRNVVILPAYFPADLEAYAATGELPPGWSLPKAAS